LLNIINSVCPRTSQFFFVCKFVQMPS
jgi:hypothetical protein